MRLAVYQKEDIKKELLSGITKKTRDLSDALNVKVQELADSKIPSEVRDMFKKYPSLSRERWGRSVEIRYPEGDYQNYYYNAIMSGEDKEYLLTNEEVNANQEIADLAKELYEAKKSLISLNRDIDKLLDAINTHKQLKDSFPAGYEVLQKLMKENKKDEPDLTNLPKSITERLEDLNDEAE